MSSDQTLDLQEQTKPDYDNFVDKLRNSIRTSLLNDPNILSCLPYQIDFDFTNTPNPNQFAKECVNALDATIDYIIYLYSNKKVGNDSLSLSREVFSKFTNDEIISLESNLLEQLNYLNALNDLHNQNEFTDNNLSSLSDAIYAVRFVEAFNARIKSNKAKQKYSVLKYFDKPLFVIK